MSGVEASGPAQSPGTSETSAPGPAQVSVNGVDDSPEPVKPSQTSGIPGTPPKDTAASTALPPWDSPPQFHPRCSSLGDLLGEGPRRPRKPVERLYRAQLEVKVASEQTEKLLNKVLGSEPAPVSAETLLSQAVEQLRQATQVLQEIRDRSLRPGRVVRQAPHVFFHNLFTVYTWKTQRPPSPLPLLGEKFGRGLLSHSFDKFVSRAFYAPAVVPGPGEAPWEKINKHPSPHAQRDHKRGQ